MWSSDSPWIRPAFASRLTWSSRYSRAAESFRSGRRGRAGAAAMAAATSRRRVSAWGRAASIAAPAMSKAFSRATSASDSTWGRAASASPKKPTVARSASSSTWGSRSSGDVEHPRAHVVGRRAGPTGDAAQADVARPAVDPPLHERADEPAGDRALGRALEDRGHLVLGRRRRCSWPGTRPRRLRRRHRRTLRSPLCASGPSGGIRRRRAAGAACASRTCAAPGSG